MSMCVALQLQAQLAPVLFQLLNSKGSLTAGALVFHSVWLLPPDWTGGTKITLTVLSQSLSEVNQ